MLSRRFDTMPSRPMRSTAAKIASASPGTSWLNWMGLIAGLISPRRQRFEEGTTLEAPRAALGVKQVEGDEHHASGVLADRHLQLGEGRAIARNPDAVEELAPGKRLVAIPVSLEERAKRLRAGAMTANRELTQTNDAKLLPIVQKAKSDNPTITIREIATLLDEYGVKPRRGDKWSPATVAVFLKRNGL